MKSYIYLVSYLKQTVIALCRPSDRQTQENIFALEQRCLTPVLSMFKQMSHVYRSAIPLCNEYHCQ